MTCSVKPDDYQREIEEREAEIDRLKAYDYFGSEERRAWLRYEIALLRKNEFRK